MSQKRSILKSQFGFVEFRAFQEDAIDAILSGRDLLMVLPTGGGKSLSFQLPTLMMSGTTVVISPLLALMQDQVKALRARGLSATMISSMQSSLENKESILDLYNADVKFLYLSPERLNTDSMRHILSEIDINYFVIDEAHCISEWGHEFRADYRELKRLREYFPLHNIAAFTATATPNVQDDIISSLDLREPLRLQGKVYRENLKISAKQRVGNGYSQLKDFIDDHRDQSGIVYALSRKSVEAISQYLNSIGCKTSAYHAGMSGNEREETFDAFVKDEISIIVATIAFGMGIDKSNIRFVVHMSLPKTIENYYQEIGRAGRDTDNADLLLLYNNSDIMQHRRFIDEANNQEHRELMIYKLNAIYQYATSQSCRHKQIASYFDDVLDVCQTNCDNCLDPNPESVQITKESQMLLSAIYKTDQRFGKTYIVDLVRGSKEQKILSNAHDSLSVYGVGAQRSKKELFVVLDRLFEIEAIDTNEFGGIIIMTIGVEILKSKRDVFVRKDRLEFKKSRSKVSISEEFRYDKDLFESLRELRSSVAKDNKVPPYIVFSDKTLKELCAKIPITKEQMLQINGIAEIKFQKYAEPFLQLLKKVQNKRG